MGSKATTEQTRYLLIWEVREHGYFHLYGRIVTDKYENSRRLPYGLDDDYSDGLKYSDLRTSCQGSEDSQRRTGEQEPVYGFAVEYRECYRLDLRTVKRMAKTLERIDKGLEKLSEARGYVRSYGEYAGRVAETLGCAGIVMERAQTAARMTGERYEWLSVGEGVNRINHRVYLWQREGQADTSAEAAS